jgi:hypothetical protein
MKGPNSFGDGYGYAPVYDFAEAAAVLRRVSELLDAGAYDVVIGERHRELLDEHFLDQHLLDQQPVRNAEYHQTTKLDGLLWGYLVNCPEGPEADDPARLLMEILSREQDASYIEAKGLAHKALAIVFGHHSSLGHLYGRGSGCKPKVSDECARRAISKYRNNETLWALLIKEPMFVDFAEFVTTGVAPRAQGSATSTS